VRLFCSMGGFEESVHESGFYPARLRSTSFVGRGAAKAGLRNWR
jgi:hypothetical protein